MASTWMDRWALVGSDLLPWVADLVGTPVGWSLKACLVLLTAAFLSLVLHRATASLRHRVWLMALTAVLLLPLLEWGLPSLPVLPARAEVAVPPLPAPGPSLPGVPSTAPVAEAPPAPVPTPEPRSPASPAVAPEPPPLPEVVPASGRSGEVAASTEHATMLPAPERERAEGQESSSGVRASTAAGSNVPEVDRTGEAGSGLSPAGWAVGVWSAGVALWSLLLAVGLVRVELLYRRGDPAPERARSVAGRVARSVGLERPVPVRLSQGIPVPVTWGWLRPRILLPASALTWSDSRLERVLTHEMAHVKRGDWFTGMMAEVTRCVHWFNPLVWLAVSRLRTEQERACDDRVLRAGARASDYAMDLLDVARTGWRRMTPAPVVPLARSPKLSGRIRELLDPERRRSEQRSLPAAAMSAGGIALAFLPMVMVSPATPRPETPFVESTPPVPGGSVATSAIVLAAVEGALPAGEPTGSEAASPSDGAPVFDAASMDEPASVADAARASAGLGVTPLPAPRWTLPRLTFPLEPARFAQQVAVCTYEPGQRHSSRINVDDDDDWTIEWSTDDCSVEVELRGRVEFNAAEDGIASMGRNASFEVEERIGGTRRRLVAEEDGSGGASYRYWRNRDEAEFDTGARAWFAAFLPQLFRHTTLQAEERVARIFAASGTRGVLEEVGRMGSDHVAARYLGLLMEQPGFEPDEVPEVLGIVAERMDSDHYVAEVLGAVGDRWGIRPEFQAPYMEAVRRIESDHYAHETLLVLLERDDLAPGTIRQVVQASAAIDSDHYKASLLRRVAARGPIPSEERPAYIQAVADMDSDHYQAEVVSAFLDDGPLDPSEVAEVLGLSETISSDHYRAEVLARIGREFELEGPAVSAFLRSAAGIDSDHHASEVGGIVASRQDLTGEQVELVLDLAAGIDSDHARSQVMITLIREQPLSAEARTRFRDLALAIDSDHYQNEVLAALARSER